LFTAAYEGGKTEALLAQGPGFSWRNCAAKQNQTKLLSRKNCAVILCGWRWPQISRHGLELLLGVHLLELLLELLLVLVHLQLVLVLWLERLLEQLLLEKRGS
jgi:hypothetical protein